VQPEAPHGGGRHAERPPRNEKVICPSVSRRACRSSCIEWVRRSFRCWLSRQRIGTVPRWCGGVAARSRFRFLAEVATILASACLKHRPGVIRGSMPKRVALAQPLQIMPPNPHELRPRPLFGRWTQPSQPGGLLDTTHARQPTARSSWTTTTCAARPTWLERQLLRVSMRRFAVGQWR
jgi:hypothetical protein